MLTANMSDKPLLNVFAIILNMYADIYAIISVNYTT